MEDRISPYMLHDATAILTPALLIYPEVVDANIQATLRLTGGFCRRASESVSGQSRVHSDVRRTAQATRDANASITCRFVAARG